MSKIYRHYFILVTKYQIRVGMLPLPMQNRGLYERVGKESHTTAICGTTAFNLPGRLCLFRPEVGKRTSRPELTGTTSRRAWNG